MFAVHQAVRVTRDVPSKQVTRGMVGAVVVLHEHSYEVEFVQPDGSTALQVVLSAEDLESAEDLRVVREYQCVFGHRWRVNTNQRSPELAPLCAEGHEPVVALEHLPPDEVQIVVRPAIDSQPGQYQLVLLDRADRLVIAS